MGMLTRWFVPGSLLAVACAWGGAGQIDPAQAWRRHAIESGLLGADGARLADANGDGLADVITGWEQSGIVAIYLNPGVKAADSPWPKLHFPKVNDVEDAVVVDLDGDGAPDAVSCCEGKTRSVFVHWAPKEKSKAADVTQWAVEPFPVCAGREQWMFCQPLQIDGKDGIDLVVGSKSNGAGVSWLQAPADPRKMEDWKLHRISDAGWIMSLIARDMDGDGDRDVLLSDRKGRQRGVRWLENPGPGEAQTKPWKSHVIGAAGLEVLFLDTGDLDGDGREDIAAMTPESCVLLRREDKTGLSWGSTPLTLGDRVGSGKAVTIADLDGDGKQDLILTFERAGVGGKSGVVWRKGAGRLEGDWPRGEISGADGTKFDLAPALDLDGDGDLDVITTEENDNAKGGKPGLGLVWYRNPLR